MMGTCRDDVPHYLRDHYDHLNALIKGGEIAKASEYFYSLNRSDYDMIVERAKRGFPFETIVCKIEGLTKVKKTNELYRLSNHDGDENYLF